MKVLVIGSGGREHALTWKISQSPLVDKIYCAPGNAGISSLAECVDIKPDDFDGLIDFAKKNNIDLTVVGPEQPLVDGIADRFEEEGLLIYGPKKEGAILEGSKIFAKKFMQKHNIPTAKYVVFENPVDARNYIGSGEISCPTVIKADGLAAGKGVVICENMVQGMNAITELMENKKFGKAGEKIVLEEFLVGWEASIHIITDGKDYLILPSAKDHKKIYDGEKGPNTGGMGAVSPSPQIDATMNETIKTKIIEPFMEGLKKEGINFKGTVFFGLMLTKKGPYVLEFNVRFGDPETQVILPRVENDIVPILYSVAKGKLEGDIKMSPNVAVNVVAVSRGYPGKYEKGFEISLPEPTSSNITVFHAGTKFNDEGKLITNGGRVISVTALAPDIESARKEAYGSLKQIKFKGMFFRKDIAAL